MPAWRRDTDDPERVRATVGPFELTVDGDRFLISGGTFRAGGSSASHERARRAVVRTLRRRLEEAARSDVGGHSADALLAELDALDALERASP